MTLLFLCFLLLAACLLLEDRLWLSAQRLPRNVSLYGEDLSSASFEQAKRVIGTVVADKSDDVIVIDVGEQSFSCFRRELGYPLDGSALLRLIPHTGRTHQLRVHCAHPAGLNRPIIGDRLYGGIPAARLMLHASYLSFRHPEDGHRLFFQSDIYFPELQSSDQ